jgi:glutaconate CoA-transferase subunit B
MLGGSFVNTLDYMTSPGFLEGGDSREKSGLFPEGTGPSMLLSTKGVFRFDPETKEMYLAQIHPRVRVEDVKKVVPWNLKIAPDLTETVPPTEEEINFIRRFAPAQSAGRKLATELVIRNLAKRAERKKAG